MHFHSEWFSVILHLNAHELLAFVHILLIVRCHGDHILQTESIITNWCNRSWREDFSDHLFQNDTTPMADVNFTSLVTSCINNVLSLRFVYCCLGDLHAKLQRILKGFMSVVAQRVFTLMMRIMQRANRGLACRIPWCRSHSRLFSALVVNVQAHENMRAIKPCNTNLYCIVVKSWHCELHRKLAINSNIKRWWISMFNIDLHVHIFGCFIHCTGW